MGPKCDDECPIRNTQIRDTQTPKEKIQTHRRESHLKIEAEIGVV